MSSCADKACSRLPLIIEARDSETPPMPINLKARSILTLGELGPTEIRFLLRLAAEFKAARLVSRGPGSRARTLP